MRAPAPVGGKASFTLPWYSPCFMQLVRAPLLGQNGTGRTRPPPPQPLVRCLLVVVPVTESEAGALRRIVCKINAGRDDRRWHTCQNLGLWPYQNGRRFSRSSSRQEVRAGNERLQLTSSFTENKKVVTLWEGIAGGTVASWRPRGGKCGSFGVSFAPNAVNKLRAQSAYLPRLFLKLG